MHLCFMKFLVLMFFLGTTVSLIAQKDSLLRKITFSAYLESYYGYDFGNPKDHKRPGFMFSHDRHNELGINLAFIKASFEYERVHANLAFMAGTYSNANLSSEPGVLKNVYEANAGVQLSKKHQIWLDAGIFASHIGFESAIGKDCWTLSRSMLADNSPYYESGIKLSYTDQKERWFFSLLGLNGWQHIQQPDGYSAPGVGHQLTFKPNKKWSVNSSSFVGSNTPDSTRKMRYFHNLYGIFQLNQKWGLMLGFDLGLEQKTKHGAAYNCWYSPVCMLRYQSNKKWSTTLRGEYYSDPQQVMIKPGAGFETIGYSLNVDYALYENVLFRIEGKGLTSRNKVFEQNGEPTRQNLAVYGAFIVAF